MARKISEGKGPVNHDRSLEMLREQCRQAGIKVTHQRLEIFREISRAKDHPSAEILYERLKRRLPTISLDTVYRTLATFEGLGLIKKVHLLSEQTRFDPDTGIHHHFICARCRKIIDFDWPDFDSVRPPEQTGQFGKVLGQQAELRGICKECLEKEADKRKE